MKDGSGRVELNSDNTGRLMAQALKTVYGNTPTKSNENISGLDITVVKLTT